MSRSRRAAPVILRCGCRAGCPETFVSYQEKGVAQRTARAQGWSRRLGTWRAEGAEHNRGRKPKRTRNLMLCLLCERWLTVCRDGLLHAHICKGGHRIRTQPPYIASGEGGT